MILTIQKYHIFITMILTLTSAKIKSLKCIEGNNVKFDFSCPEEFKDSRFKKLFKGHHIAWDGILISNQKYLLNENKSHITLKECNEDDEGTYVWMCGKSNINKQFHLEVIKVAKPSSKAYPATNPALLLLLLLLIVAIITGILRFYGFIGGTRGNEVQAGHPVL